MILLAIESFFGDTFGGENWTFAWLPLCMLAVMTAIILYSALLMIGRAFNIRELETFAKSEILQSAATAFMAMFLVVIVNGAMVLTSQFIAGDVYCDGQSINIPYAFEGEEEKAQMAMDNAFEAIRCRLQSRASEVAAIQGSISGGNKRTEFNRLNIALSSFGITFFKGDWVGDWYKEVEEDRITNNLATTLLIGLNAQSAILKYVKANMLHVFIPIGILMRSFFVTRNTGALFISIGIGMYFIFPIFFVLLDPGFVPSPPPPSPPQEEQQMYCYATMSNALSMIQSYESSGGNAMTIVQQQQLNSDLSKSYIALILHPMIAFFLTMVFVRYIMSVLGGDTYELTRMVSKVV